jgi:hypothetical protein
MFPERPSSLADLTDEQAARALSRRFGDVAAAAKDLNVDRTDLRRLTWSNPAILDAAHERMELFVDHMWGEAVDGLDSRSARVRMRAADRIFAHPRAIDHPFAGGLSLFAPAPRVRGPRRSDEAEKARAAHDRELAAEREREAAAERERAFERERVLEEERAELMVERRPSAPAPAPAMSLWPASRIRRPTRGRPW